jgi:hypothetical protein
MLASFLPIYFLSVFVFMAYSYCTTLAWERAYRAKREVNALAYQHPVYRNKSCDLRVPYQAPDGSAMGDMWMCTLVPVINTVLIFAVIVLFTFEMLFGAVRAAVRYART